MDIKSNQNIQNIAKTVKGRGGKTFFVHGLTNLASSLSIITIKTDICICLQRKQMTGEFLIIAAVTFRVPSVSPGGIFADGHPLRLAAAPVEALHAAQT